MAKYEYQMNRRDLADHLKCRGTPQTHRTEFEQTQFEASLRLSAIGRILANMGISFSRHRQTWVDRNQ